MTGTVKDGQGLPVVNATVSLLVQDISTTTDQNGIYEIKKDPVAIKDGITKGALHFSSDRLAISLKKEERVTVDLINLRGQTMERVFDGRLGQGEYVIPLSTGHTAAQVYFVKVTSGKTVTLLKHLNAVFSPGVKMTDNSPVKVSAMRKNDIVDTIKVDATGYASQKIPIESYLNTVDVILQSQTPSSPNELTATALSVSSISLSWKDNATNEDGYKIERSLSSTSDFLEIGTVGVDVTTYTDNSLTPNTSYYYRVRAYNSGGNSEYSNTADATTNMNTPAPPSELSATAESVSSISLSWKDNATNEDGFKIERSLSSTSDFQEIGTVGVDVTTYTDNSLSPNTEYFYRVLAYNSGGNSAYSNTADATTNMNTPATPSELSATALSVSSISLSWKDNATNEDGFKIERSLSSTSDFLEIGNVTENVTAYTDNGLTQNTTYYYRVCAYNNGGNSGYSNIVNSKTLPPPTYTLTINVTPSGAGTATKSPDNTNYPQGTSVNLTANANIGYVFKNWSGDASGFDNPVTVEMNGNKTVTANFVCVPVLSGPSSVNSDFELTATYEWSGLTNGQEFYEFEYSPTSATSDFALLYKTPAGTNTSSFICYVQWGESNSGTYYFRVRVNDPESGLSQWSNVLSVVYTKPPISDVVLTPTADNLLVFSSANSAMGDSVCTNYILQVGQDFSVLPNRTDLLLSTSAIQFALPSAVNNKTIISAELRLHVCMLPADWNTVYQCAAWAGAWNTNSITYNNQPNYYTSYQVSFNPPTTDAVPVKINVTNIVQCWANGTMPNYGFKLWDPNIQIPSQSVLRTTYFYCLENTTGKPELFIEYYTSDNVKSTAKLQGGCAKTSFAASASVP